MSNQIIQNTSSLQDILEAVNNLPNAGSSEPVLQDKTVTPTTSSQTAVAKNVYTTGVVTVGAIPSAYVKPTATKAATTYTPTTSNQTISAGTYCSGVQTIKGDSNLVADNIKSGVSIFGVSGNYSGSGDNAGDSSSDIETTNVTVMVNSTAEGSVIYASYLSTTGVTIEQNTLTYFAATRKYRAIISDVVLHTPVVVLTSGTITMSEPSGYAATLVTSGTGYLIYEFSRNESGGGLPDIDDPITPDEDPV